MFERHLAVVVPCFNEEERLPRFLAEIQTFVRPVGWRVTWVLVDDGSSDKTWAAMEQAKASLQHVNFCSIAQHPNQGKGAAVRAGARWAAAQGSFDAVGFLDVDLSTPLSAIADGLRQIDLGAALAIASRHAPGAHLQKAQGFFRIMVGRAFSFFSSLFHRHSFTDTQCGLKIWTPKVNDLVATQLESLRWSFDLELILRCERLYVPIHEFAVIWTNDERSRVSVLCDGPRMLNETVAHWWRWADKRLWVVMLMFLVVGFVQAQQSSNDFAIYFKQAWQKIASGDLAIFDVGRLRQGGYYYSPSFALAGAGLVFLGLPTLKVLYALASCVAILVGWVLVKRLVRNAGCSVPIGVGMAMLLFVGNNILGQMLSGNVSLWVNLFALLGMYLSTRSRSWAAGFFWALAINIKVYPIYLGLYFLWKRDLKVLAAGVVFSMLFLLAPALYWGWSQNWDLHMQQIAMLKAYGPQNNFGRLAYQSFAAMGFRSFKALALDPSLGLKLGQFAALGLNLWALSRLRFSSLRDSVWAMAWTLTCMGLATPASWIHHSGFSYVLLFALALSVATAESSRLAKGMLVIAVALYSLTTAGLIGNHANNWLESYSVPTLGLVLLALAAGLMMQRQRHSQSSVQWDT